MNILIAKTILQIFIDENDLPLWEDDAQGNYDYLCRQAEKRDEDEVILSLLTIESLGMIHILANK